MQQTHREYCNTENYIHHHTCNHHYQALPCGLASEFPWLWRLCHLFFIHTLIHHSCNFYISTKRKPAYTIFAITFLKAEQFYSPCIEKQIKFFDLDTKHSCSKKMPKLMQGNQYR